MSYEVDCDRPGGRSRYGGDGTRPGQRCSSRQQEWLWRALWKTPKAYADSCRHHVRRLLRWIDLAGGALQVPVEPISWKVQTVRT